MAPKLGPGFSPMRVVVDDNGLGVDTKRALRDFGIKPDIVFLRKDGWTLGAPKQFERVAFLMWRGYWTHFVRRPHTAWTPIEKYGGA